MLTEDVKANKTALLRAYKIEPQLSTKKLLFEIKYCLHFLLEVRKDCDAALFPSEFLLRYIFSFNYTRLFSVRKKSQAQSGTRVILHFFAQVNPKPLCLCKHKRRRQKIGDCLVLTNSIHNPCNFQIPLKSW